ncbi:MAG: VOC family protein [Geobacter sp.]|nr:VOC family protein [Geobacter sp.]
MTCNPVVWFEIYVQKMARAKKFYEAVFGLTLTPLDSPIPDMELWSFPMAEGVPGATGALVKMAGKDSGGGGTLIYFSCADCSVEAAKAAKSGGQIFREKFSIGQYGFIALVYDTEGNMIGLHSMQ